jgi:hypothetical protein
VPPPEAPWGAGLPPPGQGKGRRAAPIILLILLVLLLLNAIGHAIQQSQQSSGDNGLRAPGTPRPVAAALVQPQGRTSTCS